MGAMDVKNLAAFVGNIAQGAAINAPAYMANVHEVKEEDIVVGGKRKPAKGESCKHIKARDEAEWTSALQLQGSDRE